MTRTPSRIAAERGLRQRNWHLNAGALTRAALVLGLAATHFALSLHFVEADSLARAQLQARALESQTRLAIDTVAQGMRGAADRLKAGSAPNDAADVPRLLAGASGGAAIPHSLSLADARGKVLASSNGAGSDAAIDLSSLDSFPSPGVTVLTESMGEVAAATAARQPRKSQGASFALVRQVDGPNREPRLLVAVLDTQELAKRSAALIEDANVRTILTSRSGRVLQSDRHALLNVGGDPAGSAYAGQVLPATERGSTIVRSIGAPWLIVAHHTLRDWPQVVVVVEQSYDQAGSVLARSGLWSGLAALLGWMAIASAVRAKRLGWRKELFVQSQLSALNTKVTQSEERWKLALDAAGHGVWDVDLRMETGKVSAQLMSILGYPGNAFAWTPTRLRQLMHPDDIQTALRALQAHMTGRAPAFDTEVRIQAGDGQWKWLRARGSLVAAPGGRRPGTRLIGTITDMSERRHFEQKLHASEQRFRAVFEQAAAGIALHAISASGSATVRVSVNPALCRMLGVTREELLATSAGSHTHPDDAPAAAEAMRQLLAGRVASIALEQRYRHKDGHFIWMAVAASLASDGHGPRYVVAVLEDITPRRKALAELQQAREREMLIGARIQQSLLVTPPPPHLPGVWLSTISQASQGIDGDFVEVIRQGADCVDIIAGDVMGKGINAALVGAAVKMQFTRTLAELVTRAAPGAQPLPQPAAILAAVDQAMTPALQALDAFVTLSYVRIDNERHLLTWAGCGHEEPLVVRRDGTLLRLANQHPPLGVSADAQYTQEELAISHGDGVLLHSDGVSDARLPDGERVGHERLRSATVRLACQHPTPAAVLHMLRRDLLQGATVNDDLTLVFARICDSGTQTRRLELVRQASELRKVRAAVEGEGVAAGLTPEEAHVFAVAAVEAFTNIVRHAVGVPDGAPVEILLHRAHDALVVDLVCAGEHFLPPPDLPDTRLEDCPEGGFGLRIIALATDCVEYRHCAGVNTTRLVRRLPART